MERPFLFVLIAFYVALSVVLHRRLAAVDVMDEREDYLRLQVHASVSRAVEFTLAACTVIFLARAALFGTVNTEALGYLVVIGGAGNISQLFALRRARRDPATA